MTQNRVGQAASGARLPEKMLVCIDPTSGIGWIKQCEAYAHCAIEQDFVDDPALLKTRCLPRKKRSIWHRLWHRKRPTKKQVSITKKLTVVLEARTRPLARVDANAPTEGMIINKYWVRVSNTQMDANATEPMSLEEIMR